MLNLGLWIAANRPIEFLYKTAVIFATLNEFQWL